MDNNNVNEITLSRVEYNQILLDLHKIVEKLNRHTDPLIHDLLIALETGISSKDVLQLRLFQIKHKFEI